MRSLTLWPDLCSLSATGTKFGFCVHMMVSTDDIFQHVTECSQELEDITGKRTNFTTDGREVARCIAVKVGLIVEETTGRISSQKLINRIKINENKRITNETREFFLGLVPNCTYWKQCIDAYCL